jgi:hypothetical protein
MQQKKYITIFALAAMAFSSCSKDYLTLNPEGQINGANFYKTATDFQEAVVGAYVPLREAALYSFYPEEMRSDNTEYDYNAKDRGGIAYEQIADFMDDKSNGVTANVWTADYKGIQRANVILDRLAKNTDSVAITPAVRRQIIGEAKALRAHYYFELVRLFGKLPIYLHETTDTKNAIVDHRSSIDSVYGQIISDFNDALALLPAVKFPQDGRWNKGSVSTELGLVYLTRKDYAKATPFFESVTTMGYDLLPNYADVFKLNNKLSKESIFEIQYKAGTDGQSSSFIYRFMMYTPDTKGVLGVKYTNLNGGWNVPTDDIVAVYEPNDKRLDASVAVQKGHLNTDGDYIPDSVSSILTVVPNDTTIRKKMIRKQYQPSQGYGINSNTDDDWPVYRYSDLLLMLAECYNMTGRSGDALPLLNKVRVRAGLAASAETDPAALGDIIAHERRVELAFENHRWFDLVRTDKAIPVMKAFGVAQKAKYGYLLPQSYDVNTDRLIYAIPFRETQYNPGLGQNNGYN